MREILFRGKRTDNGEWAYGSLLQVTVKGETYYLIFGDSYSFNGHDVTAKEHAPIDPETIGQYTGLMDRNGKLIYEGDIVDHHTQGDILVNRGTVCWNHESGKWSHRLKTMNPDFWLYNPKAYEVIGNIYDNPELLEV